MGSRTSRHHKATSPYSSWGQSFDDLLCGPGKICAEEWTPLPSRTQSLSPSRRRRHSIAVSANGAEVYTVRRSSYSDGVIDQQPMPIYGEHLRSPYHVPGTARSHRSRSRRRSYHPREPSPHFRRPVTPWNPRIATKKKKKKRKRSMHRVDTYPIESSRRATSEIVRVHRHKSRSRSRSAAAKKKPSTLDGRPPWRDVISPRRYQEYLNPSPIAVVPPLNHSIKSRSSPLGSNSPAYKANSKKSYKASSIMGSSSMGSGTGSGGTRVIPPRGKTTAEPPPAFRVKHVEDKKYQRIPTAFPGRKY